MLFIQTEPEDGEDNIKNRECNFQCIGKKMIEEINGKYIEEKYNIKPSKEFGKKLHQERVKWLKEIYQKKR